MTDRGKSDAQLDAEAYRRLEEVPVVELIEDHRALYRADLNHPRLHQRDGEFGIGMPFAHTFERLVNWERSRQAVGVRPSSPGPAAPWVTARYAQWAECRRSHPEHHDRPEWRGSLCHQLIGFTVIREMDLVNTCAVLGVTSDRAGRTLRNALLWVERYMDNARDREQQRQRSQSPTENFAWRDLPLEARIAYLRKIIAQREPVSPEERHDQPGIHQETCPKCIKRKNANAA